MSANAQSHRVTPGSGYGHVQSLRQPASSLCTSL